MVAVFYRSHFLYLLGIFYYNVLSNIGKFSRRDLTLIKTVI